MWKSKWAGLCGYSRFPTTDEDDKTPGEYVCTADGQSQGIFHFRWSSMERGRTSLLRPPTLNVSGPQLCIRRQSYPGESSTSYDASDKSGSSHKRGSIMGSHVS